MTSVVTFYQARCVSCDVARADGRAFSLRAVNRMFSFAAFFTARVTLCVIRYDLLHSHTMRWRIGDRSAGGSVPIPSQLHRARTRFSTKIGSITNRDPVPGPPNAGGLGKNLDSQHIYPDMGIDEWCSAIDNFDREVIHSTKCARPFIKHKQTTMHQ